MVDSPLKYRSTPREGFGAAQISTQLIIWLAELHHRFGKDLKYFFLFESFKMIKPEKWENNFYSIIIVFIVVLLLITFVSGF